MDAPTLAQCRKPLNPKLLMDQPVRVTFPNGRTACVAQVHAWTELATVLHKLGLQQLRPTLVLIGGASKISPEDLEHLRRLFVDVLAPLAQAFGAYVVDGGTDAGVMRLMGQARAVAAGTFPLIGVAPVGAVRVPGATEPGENSERLEPHHSHFVLVPGNQWGDESPWLAHVATLLSQDSRSATILINGGEITWKDASQAVRSSRPMLVIAGSGRVADILAEALRGGQITDGRATELVESGLMQAIDLAEGPQTLATVLKAILSKRSE